MPVTPHKLCKFSLKRISDGKSDSILKKFTGIHRDVFSLLCMCKTFACAGDPSLSLTHCRFSVRGSDASAVAFNFESS